MENLNNQREVEECLRDALKNDKARIQTGRISRFGLIELSRQRLRPSIGETSNGQCPKCQGTGRIRDFQSSSLHIIRMIQDQSNKKQEQKISVQVPIDVATYLLNEKRDLIIQSESENNNKIFIIANKYFDVPQFKITTSELNDKKSLSYQEIEIPETDIDEDIQQISKEVVEPAVKGLIPEKRTKKNKSLFGFIKGLIASDNDKEDDLPEEAEDPKNTIPKREPQEDFKKQFKNNRRRRNNRGRNQVKENHSENESEHKENISNTPSVTVNTKQQSHGNQKVITDLDHKKPQASKNKPVRKPQEELKDINLEDVGLKLVETSKKTKVVVENSEVKKPTKIKKPSWAMKDDAKTKTSEKLVMIETKASTVKAKSQKKSPVKKSVKKTAR